MKKLSHTFIALLALVGCSARPPTPSGPPPEYETPRSYEPKKNIDAPGTEPDPIDQLLEEEPPAPQSTAPPTPAPDTPAPDTPAPGTPAPPATPAPSAPPAPPPP